MDLDWIAAQPWFETLQSNELGIWTAHEGRCAIGMVLLARKTNQIALIRKADTSNYEFSSKLTLPGGVIRRTGGETFLESVSNSFLPRVEKECGLQCSLLRDVRLLEFEATVTGYTAKDKERRTAVLVAEGFADGDCALKAGDHSIEHAGWYAFPLQWGEIAPANCLIIARALTADIAQREKQTATAHVDRALAQCNKWAEDVDFPAHMYPWPG